MFRNGALTLTADRWINVASFPVSLVPRPFVRFSTILSIKFCNCLFCFLSLLRLYSTALPRYCQSGNEEENGILREIEK